MPLSTLICPLGVGKKNWTTWLQALKELDLAEAQCKQPSQQMYAKLKFQMGTKRKMVVKQNMGQSIQMDECTQSPASHCHCPNFGGWAGSRVLHLILYQVRCPCSQNQWGWGAPDIFEPGTVPLKSFIKNMVLEVNGNRHVHLGHSFPYPDYFISNDLAEKW